MSRPCVPLVVLGALAACRSETAPDITLVLEGPPREAITFAPESSYAEYLEMPDDRHELRLTFASFESSCESYVAAPEGQPVVSVLLVTPPREPPAPGQYAFGSVPDLSQPVSEASAVPRARVGKKTWTLEPGGSLRLTSVHLEPHGMVEGILDFTYPGDAQHRATRLQGKFRARLCRHAPAPKR